MTGRNYDFLRRYDFTWGGIADDLVAIARIKRDLKTRPPETPRETWTAQALASLARLDPDHAAQRNDQGFDAADSFRGHRWAKMANDPRMGLTEDEWTRAFKTIWPKYTRQLSPPP